MSMIFIEHNRNRLRKEFLLLGIASEFISQSFILPVSSIYSKNLGAFGSYKKNFFLVALFYLISPKFIKKKNFENFRLFFQLPGTK